MKAECQKKKKKKKKIPSNCGAGKAPESPLDCRDQTSQSVLRETNLEYSLEGLMLKLKLQYSGQLMRRANLLNKTLILGNTEDSRRRE